MSRPVALYSASNKSEDTDGLAEISETESPQANLAHDNVNQRHDQDQREEGDPSD